MTRDNASACNQIVNGSMPKPMATVRASTDGVLSISDPSIQAWDRFPVAGPSTALLRLFCNGHGSDDPSKESVSI